MPLPIHTLQQEETIKGPLLLTDAKGKKTRTGSDYLDLKLQDASGQITAKMWQSSVDILNGMALPAPVYIVARVDAFQGRPQLVIESLEAYAPSDEEYQALIPASNWASDILWQEITDHLRQEIVDDALWELVDAILSHPVVQERALTIPAASHNHHAYRSGLAEHMLSMLRLSARIASHYENYYAYPIHHGLLAAGVLMHDIGKIWELSGDIDTSYTDEGKLLGHIFMAARWVEELARELNTPHTLIVELQHLILSHHGMLEYGSPKVPQTIEAMVLHHIDKLDADMNQWMAALSTPGWTDYQRNYARAFLRPDHMRESWTTTGVEQDTIYDAQSRTVHNAHGPGYIAPPAEASPQARQTPVHPHTKNRKSSDKEPSSPSDAPTPQAPKAETLGLFDGLDN